MIASPIATASAKPPTPGTMSPTARLALPPTVALILMITMTPLRRMTLSTSSVLATFPRPLLSAQVLPPPPLPLPAPARASTPPDPLAQAPLAPSPLAQAPLAHPPLELLG
ncbi:hypothetical protein MPH_11741 [Macrophomina phaseolina MS6]|uniref:Uncharacterized protein n=1 Tax=Macrophomina phaseolina (strain MS6) TaxID=1126212 RepID=K2R9K8_MACPH|nr:hypothetical protein MPH_11741 [Macrophomina phaseolina MS6]